MTEQPPLFQVDYGMFRFFLDWDGEGKVPREWTEEHFEVLKKLDVARELETWHLLMATSALHYAKGKGSAKDVHPAGIVESSECMILIHALLDIITASSDEPAASEAKKNPLVRLAKKDPKIAIALAFTVGQLSVVALNRPQEKQYARGKTRYDNLKAANAAKDKRPPSKDEFLKLVKQSESLFKKKESRNKWLQQQLGCSRATIHRYFKRFQQS